MLVHIFNYSLQSGVFPTGWKRAIVRPIPKRYPPRESGHFVTCNNLLDPLQSGFRKRHSTHTALVKVVDDIRLAIDKGEVILVAAVDLTQAFDRIVVSLLIGKLATGDFSDSACDWIHSFLLGRSQIVLGPNGKVCAPLTRNAGVP